MEVFTGFIVVVVCIVLMAQRSAVVHQDTVVPSEDE